MSILYVYITYVNVYINTFLRFLKMAQNERQKMLEKIRGDILYFNGEIISIIFKVII